MLDVGHLLDNRYRLDERIATGGMGDVWKGTDVVLGRTIAVKVLRDNMMSDPEFSARFYGEARMMAAFRHPGVVEVFDYASSTGNGDDQCAYLVMAYVEGEPLSSRLKEVGRLDVTETMSIVSQAADALHAAHENGTVHRDVKPGNLMIRPTGAVILVDFGVARSNAVTSVTGINSIVGTALYMAPEQVAKGKVTPATDIYALGAVAYHCLAGRPPFDGDNALQVALMHLEDEPAPLPDEVPAPVRQLISRAMAKHPDDRFTSAADFAEAALAATRPLDYRTMTGTSLTGTSLAAPLSPSAPTRQVPMPRNTRPAPAVAPAPPQQPRGRGRRTSRGQLAVLVMVITLGLAAAGLALALALRPTNSDSAVVEPTPTPSSEVSETTDSDEPTGPAEAPPTGDSQPNVPAPPPNTKPTPSKSASPTPTKTSKPPASQPPDDPPDTGEPTTPTTEPTTPDEGGGEEDGNQGAGPGVTGVNIGL
ncbi:serine/threonine protein kinase [Actinoplanes sp. NBRC 103695]|uniref:serine/threonine-protein kinase n=1 Tax=Actinoplanes sp. NBRC 103695 TaxID=3032202 RepID=UPI0024A59E68|nr:serine/threonine protein kinase [Actinoplanes sp. NBRC 103695]GLY97717.1 putative serine/threonine-protein kinase PknA [Actinoplanes sp. NBRC 103695]